MKISLFYFKTFLNFNFYKKNFLKKILFLNFEFNKKFYFKNFLVFNFFNIYFFFNIFKNKNSIFIIYFDIFILKFLFFKNNDLYLIKKKNIDLKLLYNESFLFNFLLNFFKNFSFLFYKYFLKFKFNLKNFYGNIFYLYFLNNFFYRVLNVIVFINNVFIFNIPKFIKFFLKLNNVILNNNIFKIFKKYIYIKFNIFLNFLNYINLKKYFFISFREYFKYFKIFNKKKFLKKELGFFENKNLIIFLNFFDNINFSKNIFYNKIYIQLSFINIFNNYLFNFKKNIFFNFSYFDLNKNFCYIIKIFLKIFNFKSSFILDKILNFPFKKIIILFFYKFWNLIGLNLNINFISNIINILNYDFFYYKFFFIIEINFCFFIIIEEDLISEIFKFYNIRKNIFYIFNNFLNKYFFKNNFFYYKFKYILYLKKYNEVYNFNFINVFDDFNFSLNKFSLKILNPISYKMNVMRSSLLYGLIKNFLFIYKNFNKYIYIYEIGKIFFFDSRIKFNKIFEKSKFSLIIFDYNLNYLKIFSILINNINDIFYNYNLIYYNPIFSFNPILNYFYQVNIILNERIIGWFGILNNFLLDKYKIKEKFLFLDLDFKKILIKKKFNFYKKKIFIKKDLTFNTNLKLFFYIFGNLIKKFFYKKKKNIYLYNLYFLNEYYINDKNKNINIRIIFVNLNFYDVNIIFLNLINYLKEIKLYD